MAAVMTVGAVLDAELRLGLDPDRVTILFPIWRPVMVAGVEHRVPRWGIYIDSRLVAWTVNRQQAERWVQLLTEPVSCEVGSGA